MRDEIIFPPDLEKIIAAALSAHGATAAVARSVARALTRAEMDGKYGHGLSRLSSYAMQLRVGKVNSAAQPTMTTPKPAVLKIDADNGFAFPAFDLLRDNLPPLADVYGIAMAGITRSHHFGVAGHHVEDLAAAGYAALLFGNAPAAMAPAGGRTRLFGTNPIAFAAPVHQAPPLVIDLATSQVARGRIMKASRVGETIPPHWALDEKGEPTTDPTAALKGSMTPMGGSKGAALALMIEVLAGAIIGGAFAYQASSFLDAEGAPPNVAQMMIVINANCFIANSGSRLADLVAAITADGARIPGSGRHERRQRAEKEGLCVNAALLTEAKNLSRRNGQTAN